MQHSPGVCRPRGRPPSKAISKPRNLPPTPDSRIGAVRNLVAEPCVNTHQAVHRRAHRKRSPAPMGIETRASDVWFGGRLQQSSARLVVAFSIARESARHAPVRPARIMDRSGVLDLEHGPAAFRKLRALPHHARGDAVDIRNLRTAQPHRIPRAQLRLLRCVGMRYRRHGTHRQRHCDQQRALPVTKTEKTHLTPPLLIAPDHPSREPRSSIAAQEDNAAPFVVIRCNIKNESYPRASGFHCKELRMQSTTRCNTEREGLA